MHRTINHGCVRVGGEPGYWGSTCSRSFDGQRQNNINRINDQPSSQVITNQLKYLYMQSNNYLERQAM